MPLTIDEFIKVLVNQTDFRMEAKHLDKFNSNFKGMKEKIQFPTNIYASEDVLIESFIDSSKNISEFIGLKDQSANRIIARYGLEAIYKMFLYDNFVHADCHAGNIYVQITPKQKKEQSLYEKTSDYIQKSSLKYGQKLTKMFNNNIKKIFPASEDQSQQNEKQRLIFRLLKIFEEAELEIKKDINEDLNDDFDYKLIFLDTGMVTTLNEKNYVDMMYLITSVILKDSKNCVEAIRKISTSDDKQKLSRFE